MNDDGEKCVEIEQRRRRTRTGRNGEVSGDGEGCSGYKKSGGRRSVVLCFVAEWSEVEWSGSWAIRVT